MTIQQMHDKQRDLESQLNSLFALPSPTAVQADQAAQLAGEIETVKTEIKSLQNFEELKKKSVQAAPPLDVQTLPTPAPEVKAMPYATGGSKVIAKNLPSDEIAYKFGLFGMAVSGSDKAKTKLNDLNINTKAFNVEYDNALGGALVPNELSSYVIHLIEQYGVYEQYTRVEPMGSDTRDVIRITDNATAYWGSEASSLSGLDSGSLTNRIKLIAKKIHSLASFTNELEDDAIIRIGDILAGDMARAAAKKIDEAGFVGDGTSSYDGIVGVTTKLKSLSNTIANIAGLKVGSGNAYSELTMPDFVAAKGLLPNLGYTANTRWFMSRQFWAAAPERLIMAASGVTPMDFVNGIGNAKLLGIPVVFTDAMPKVEANSQVCALLGDLSLASTMGRRSQIAVKRDDSAGFLSDTVYVKTTQRVDIVVHDVGNASATASARKAGPVVGLITAAS